MPPRPRRDSLAALALAGFMALALQALWNRPLDAPDITAPLAGLAYSPFHAGDNPDADNIRADLAALAGQTGALRTYAATGPPGLVPGLAAAAGFEVTVGAWIGRDPAANQAEVEAAIVLARDHDNVRALLIGNEAVLRGDTTASLLAARLRAVRRRVTVPVGTAEPWHVWLDHPELAAAVDFIGVHILPWHEGIPAEDGPAWVADRLAAIRAAFPDIPVLITEAGWPSGGEARDRATTSPAIQARFLRRFTAWAEDREIPYFLIEAFDQPWKASTEGPPGATWGIRDADRAAKFSWTGRLYENPQWPWQAALALLAGLLPAGLWLRLRRFAAFRGRLVMACLGQAAGTALAGAAFVPAGPAAGLAGPAVQAVLLFALLLLLAAALVDAAQMCDVFWNPLRRVFRPAAPGDPPPDRSLPRVSIHLPCRDEPPGMIRATLKALSRLDWPKLEVLVLVNNSADPAAARAIAGACRALGPRFRFHDLGPVSGFKAGALNRGLALAAPDAAIVAVLDSDYQVRPDWLRALVPLLLDDPGLAIVQAPQDYRDGGDSGFKAICRDEYAGFFGIGMVQRNEADAIVQHGTMTLIRRRALDEAGGWAEWCITEDAELGLRLLCRGWQSAYVRQSFGRGLMPDGPRAWREQRQRWAFGAMQILGRYRRVLLWPGATPPGPARRWHFVTGWLPWLGDAAALVFAWAAVAWTGLHLLWPGLAGLPDPAYVIPALTVFVFRLLRDDRLRARRLGQPAGRRLGAALAGLALGPTAGRAVLAALAGRDRPFRRTPKCAPAPGFGQALGDVLPDLLLLSLLLAAIVATALDAAAPGPHQGLWMALLASQALPPAAALVTALLAADRKPLRVPGWLTAAARVGLATGARRVPRGAPNGDTRGTVDGSSGRSPWRHARPDLTGNHPRPATRQPATRPVSGPRPRKSCQEACPACGPRPGSAGRRRPPRSPPRRPATCAGAGPARPS